MKKLMSFDEAVGQFALGHPEFPPEAYYFVRDGFEFVLNNQKKTEVKLDPTRGIPILTGRELSLGLCDFALDEFGPMALFTLNQWNIKSSLDLGKIVYNLIEIGVLRQNDGDKLADFDEVFNFDKVFGNYFA